MNISSSSLTKGITGKVYYAFEVDSLHIVESCEYITGNYYTHVDPTESCSIHVP